MKAFVAMPFAQHFDQYWTAIQEVCKKRDVDLFRIDKNLSFERHIDIAIRREVRKADFVIAVLTGDIQKQIPNPNVAFEVGYAQGSGMETILLAEEAEHLPFDYQQQRTCLYHGDLEQFKQGLEKELVLLKKMVVESYTKSLKNFTQEIARCLRITLPLEYRLFKEDMGYLDEKIWYAIYYSDRKRDFRYAVLLGQSDQVSLGCWLGNFEIRPQQKDFFKQHHDTLRRHLGREIHIEFQEIGNKSVQKEPEVVEQSKPEDTESVKVAFPNLSREEQRNREFVKEVLEMETKAPGTREALKIALRLTDYVEVFEPLNLEFQSMSKKKD